MKLGVSSYCFRGLMASGEMDLIAVLDWVAKSPAGHLEIAAMDGEYYLERDDVVRDTAKHADDVGVPIVNYLVSGDLRTAEDKEIDPNAKTSTVKTTSKAAWLRRMTPALKWAVSAKAPEPAAPWRAATTSLAPRENCKNIRTKTAALAPRKPRKNRLPKGQARKAPCRETLD